MNSLGINVIQNGPNECTVETAWYAMTKAERMFLTKGHWHIDIEWKLSSNAKENVVHDLVNVLRLGDAFPRVLAKSSFGMARLNCHSSHASS